MRWFFGLLAATVIAKRPSKEEKAAEPAAEAPPAPEPPAIEKPLSNPRNYAIKLLGTCTATGKDLVGRDQATPSEYTYSLYGKGGLAVGQAISVGPPEDFMKYIPGNRPIDVLKLLPVGALEVARTYAHRSSYQALDAAKMQVTFDKTYRNFYLGVDRQILVTDGPTFTTREMANQIPAELRFGRFRFVDGSEGATGQEDGIYGLMDRAVGSLVEARVALDLLNCGWVDAGLAPSHWLDLYAGVATGIFATYELRYYMMQYLAWGEEYHRDVMGAIWGNKPLWQTWAEIDTRLAAVEADYATIGGGLLAQIAAKGTVAEWNERQIRIGEDGRGRYADQKERLRIVMGLPPLKEQVDKAAAAAK